MSICYGGWAIRTQLTNVLDENGKVKDDMVTSLEVEDIRGLPTVICELIKMGFDPSATAKAIKDAQEEQQKAKQAETVKAKRENTAKAKSALDSSVRRFVIAYNKEDSDEVKTAIGVRYGNEGMAIEVKADWPLCGYTSSEKVLEELAKCYDYEYHIEYID